MSNCPLPHREGPQPQEPISGNSQLVHSLVADNHSTITIIHGHNANIDRRKSEPDVAIQPFSTVPFAPDPDFVDRAEISAWIRDKCNRQGARAALVGLGGIGKSQLAIRYSQNVRDETPDTFVFWVHAGTTARFEEAYKGIADRLKLPGRNDPQYDILRLVSNWLSDETNGNWIMILDNADDIEVFYPSRAPKMSKSLTTVSTSLADYLPKGSKGSILVTSRSKDAAARLVGGYNRIKEVRAMDESQALNLFRNKLQVASNEKGAADLLHALDYIPLAITQAAAFINRRGRITAFGYLDEFRKNDKKKESLLDRDSGDLRRDDTASNSVVLTWQISFECIREQRRSAADLLSLMSFFNPQGIPEWILRSYSRSVLIPGNKDEVDSDFDEDLDTLQAYSLITTTADSGVCEMHALVQFCTQVWLSTTSNLKKWDREFLGLMAREFPRADFENWAKCQQLLPHIESLYKSDLSDNDLVIKWATVLHNAAWYMQKAMGKYNEAEKLNRLTLEGRQKHLGEQHRDTLTNMNNLALALRSQGRYNEAEKLNRQVLEGYKKELGEKHPFTLTSVSNLALILRFQGKYNEAEKLNRLALEGREKKLGKQHPNTLTSVINLALVLQDQGKYDEAEKLNRRALEGSEKELGEQHPDTLTSVNNLSSVLQRQGKSEEAEILYRRVLKGRERKLGEQHPDTMRSMSNLASVLQTQGKYDESEKLTRRALEGREKELGEIHPDSLDSFYNLAYLLHKRKRYEEASRLYQRACDGYKHRLGAQHPTTIACLSNFSAMQREVEQKRPHKS